MAWRCSEHRASWERSLGPHKPRVRASCSHLELAAACSSLALGKWRNGGLARGGHGTHCAIRASARCMSAEALGSACLCLRRVLQRTGSASYPSDAEAAESAWAHLRACPLFATARSRAHSSTRCSAHFPGGSKPPPGQRDSRSAPPGQLDTRSCGFIGLMRCAPKRRPDAEACGLRGRLCECGDATVCVRTSAVPFLYGVRQFFT